MLYLLEILDEEMFVVTGNVIRVIHRLRSMFEVQDKVLLRQTIPWEDEKSSERREGQWFTLSSCCRRLSLRGDACERQRSVRSEPVTNGTDRSRRVSVAVEDEVQLRWNRPDELGQSVASASLRRRSKWIFHRRRIELLTRNIVLAGRIAKEPDLVVRRSQKVFLSMQRCSWSAYC